MSDLDIAIIGAGMTGLTCARALRDTGRSVKLYDKGRAVGGRLATRITWDGYTFDHGVRHLPPDLGFPATAPWTAQTPDGELHLTVGIPSMNAMATVLAGNLDIETGCRVSVLTPVAGGWVLSFDDDREPVTAHRVVVTIPQPQATELIPDAAITDALAPVRVRPCWTAMVTVEDGFEPGFDGLFDSGADLEWMSAEHSKPGRGTSPERWVLHAGSAWSTRHLEDSKDEIEPKLINLLQGVVGPLMPSIRKTITHRWRYAFTERALGEPFISSNDDTLFVGGDWMLGHEISDAVESGRAIANSLKRSG